MPIDDFRPRRGALNGYTNSFLPNKPPDSQPSDGLVAAPGQRRVVGDFSKPDGFNPARQPLMDAAQMGDPPKPSGVPAEEPTLKRNFITDPLLGSKGNKEQLKVPKESLGRRLRRWTKRGFILLEAGILLAGGLLLGKGWLKLHEVFQGGGTAVALQADVNPNQLKGEGDGRVNVLLLGIGGQNHDGPDLTDTMVLVSIDPVNNTAALLSVPRDLWIKEPNNFVGQYQKINAAYESGKCSYLGEENSSNSNQKAINAGFKTADEAVSTVLGIPIDYTF